MYQHRKHLQVSKRQTLCSSEDCRFSRRRGDVKQKAVGANIHSFILRHCSDEVRHHNLIGHITQCFSNNFSHTTVTINDILLPKGTANININPLKPKDAYIGSYRTANL